MKAESGEEGHVVTGSRAVEPAVLEVPFELQVELIATGLLKPHRIRRIKLDPEAQDEIVDVLQ